MTTIYKILDSVLWQEAVDARAFRGAGIDLADGYIHFSTADQVRETASKHFGGRAGLVLVAVDAAGLGTDLRYEPSRGGDLFPHLYAPLDPSRVLWVKPLPLDAAGHHVFPTLS